MLSKIRARLAPEGNATIAENRGESIANITIVPDFPPEFYIAEIIRNLLESGRSYHFYGKSLLKGDELPVFLGRVLLLSPVVDRAWIAHQLIEGACGLRISPARTMSEPLLIAEI